MFHPIFTQGRCKWHYFSQNHLQIVKGLLFLFSLVGFLPLHHCSNIVLMHKLRVTVRGHHTCALQDTGSKMMLLFQNTFPKDMPHKVPLPEDCKSPGHILLEELDVSHWCMIDLLGKQDTLMLHQDCTFHLGISNQWIQDRKLVPISHK